MSLPLRPGVDFLLRFVRILLQRTGRGAIGWAGLVALSVSAWGCGDGDHFAPEADDSSGGSGATGTGGGGNTASGGDSGSGGDGGAGASPACGDGEALCGDECVKIGISSLHCGGCDQACDDDEVCDDGTCSAACSEPLQECDGNCTDLNRDSANCGQCGRSCPLGTPCVGGSCGCPDYTLFCGGKCADPTSDTDHCGSCNEGCPTGAACSDGECECPPGTELCGEACVSLNTVEHCGDCNVECASDEICAPESCIAESEPCPSGTERCGSACVDTDSAPNHCGGCNQGCPPATFCSEGLCGCFSGETLCGETCVDTETNSLNCGSCDLSCGAGQTCQDGACTCSDEGNLLCGEACIDPQSDERHCGDCTTACTGGYPCTDGECRCPIGEVLCDGVCVNTESDADHCGSCGYECPSGESCVVGACSGAVGDDCSNVLAGDISLSEIAVYQAGKINIMTNGEQIAIGQRNADVVVGKDALLRAFVELAPGFEDRVLSARLVLVDGQQVEQRFHKRTVSGDSTDSSLATTFNFQIDGELITESLSYSVELVECDEASGDEYLPRYPSGGSEDLQARTTGTLTVEYIPIVANGRTPNTDQDLLTSYADYVARLYPVSAVEYTLGSPLSVDTEVTAGGLGWDEALQQLSDRHMSDGAANNVYYYGLLEPEATEEQYCSGGCVAGIGYITGPGASWQHLRVAMGISYDNLSSAETMAHEVGHNHGRDHAPCGGASDPDPQFPYMGGRIGWWGLDYPDTLRNPSGTTDVMAYCGSVWISDYTYQGIANRVATLPASFSLLGASPVGRWRVMLTGPGGARWGVSPAGEVAAAGEPEVATILDREGNPILEVSVYRARMDHLGASSIMVPEPSNGWHAIEVEGEPALTFGASNASLP